MTNSNEPLNTKSRLFDLNYLGAAIVTGEDAEHFLQGQLSNDITHLSAEMPHHLSAYCTPKGRVLACFDVLKLNGLNSEAAYALIAPRAILDKVLPRLRMFVMRAAVKIELIEKSDLLGLQTAVADPQTSLNSLQDMGAKTFQHNNDSQRFFVLADKAISASISTKVNGLTLATENDWHLINIKQNIAEVYAQSYEAFIPQSINLDLLNGVNFKKGCYPGQEIIARIKYRGKPKTRMISVMSEYSDAIEITSPIYIDGRDSSAGVVCNYAKEGDTTKMSITLPVTHLEQGAIYLDEARTIELTRLQSPYEIVV